MYCINLNNFEQFYDELVYFLNNKMIAKYVNCKYKKTVFITFKMQMNFNINKKSFF